MVTLKKIKSDSKKYISIKSLFNNENALIDKFINSNTMLNTISLIGLFIVFQYLFSQIRFFIPDNPVPITMQTFGILLIGGLYGPRLTMLSIFSYIIIGIIGVPVFQGHSGGIDYFFGVTGGYLIGFIFASLNSFNAPKVSLPNLPSTPALFVENFPPLLINSNSSPDNSLSLATP